MQASEPIVIVDAARTPMGGLLGELAAVAAPELGATSIRATLQRAALDPERVDQVLMGCVISAGLGQAPARQAAIAAGIPRSCGCTTVNKMCGSGMQTAILAHDLIRAGSADIVVAGGFENMSRAPYLLPRTRAGMRLGHGELIDAMYRDGLEDAYEAGRLMGAFAEQTAAHYGFSRAAQDAYAIRSLERAQQAIDSGIFAREIQPVICRDRQGERQVVHDEQPPKARLEKIPQLRPAFVDNGTVTAANSSSISDGGAALLLMREGTAERAGLRPRARILGHAAFAHEPAWFTTAPIGAIGRLLESLGKRPGDVDLYEINEAFAVVVMAALKELDLDAERVNVHGGACALGHPIGASGARILVTLLNALEHHELELGVAAICIGGGEATAMAVERLSGR